MQHLIYTSSISITYLIAEYSVAMRPKANLHLTGTDAQILVVTIYWNDPRIKDTILLNNYP